MNIGFIGLGIMGSRMAANVLKTDVNLTVHNRSKDKANPLLEQGAQWADSPKDMAQNNEIIITMLSTPEVVKETALGSQGFLDHLVEGSIWIDSSTVNPSFSREMAQEAAQRNIIFLDAPVAGTKGPAEKGELLFLVGGEASTIEKCNILFEAMGKKHIHLGEVGRGASMKMLINQLLAQSMLAFTEAMALGQAMGLAETALFNVLLATPITPAFLDVLRPRLESGNYDPNFPLKWMHKDLQLITQTGYEHGVPMPSLNATKETFALAKQQGLEDEDFSAIYKFLNKAAK